MTKNIQVSFRLTQWQLAHALEIIQALEPSYHPVSLSAMMKLVCQDYLAKMSIVSNPWPKEQAIEEVRQMAMRSKAGQAVVLQANNDNDELTKIMKRKQFPGLSRPTEEQTSRAEDLNRLEAFETYQELETESITKVVTDFRPPTMEELNEETEE